MTQIRTFDKCLNYDEIDILGHNCPKIKEEVILTYDNNFLDQYQFLSQFNKFIDNKDFEFRVQSKFIAKKTGKTIINIVLNHFTFEYSIIFLIDFDEKIIKYTIPGLFYKWYVDSFNSISLPSLESDNSYNLEIRLKAESAHLIIINSSDAPSVITTSEGDKLLSDYSTLDKPTLLNSEVPLNLIASIPQKLLEETKISIGTNNFNTLDTIIYFNYKNILNEDFLYLGNKVLDDDYLGIISLDNNINLISKFNCLKESLSIKLLNSPKFVLKNNDYRSMLAKENIIFEGGEDKSNNEYLQLDFDFAKFKEHKSDLSDLNKIYISIPFILIEDSSDSNDTNWYSLCNINGTVTDFNHEKPFSGYFLLKIDFINLKISVLQRRLSKNFEELLDLSYTNLKDVTLNEKDLNSFKFGVKNYSKSKYNKANIYYRGIYIFKDNPEKFITKSTLNYQLPTFDDKVYNIDHKLIGIQG